MNKAQKAQAEEAYPLIYSPIGAVLCNYHLNVKECNIRWFWMEHNTKAAASLVSPRWNHFAICSGPAALPLCCQGSQQKRPVDSGRDAYFLLSREAAEVSLVPGITFLAPHLQKTIKASCWADMANSILMYQFSYTWKWQLLNQSPTEHPNLGFLSHGLNELNLLRKI